ncbi:DNA primase [Listeria grayi]|uniref:DNA primase n=1 Tax=Listeria grayi TaxID=1641 RepID=UPI0016261E9B|nr:DNA primase [Listeria grayi]MBC1920639.1 DNA primase [Listeria grayi]
MARRIPEEVIDRVRSEADIVDIISNYVQLKKAGRNYSGLCPFHGEKTPSFSVSPEKQIFHCFGCGKGGNVFSFLMEHDGLSFVEAVKKTAELSHVDVGIEWDDEPAEQKTEQSNDQFKMIDMHQLSAKFYHYILLETEEGSEALSYLKERGLSEQSIISFQIGFAPNHSSTITSFLAKRGMNLDLAEIAGLLVRRENGDLVDRFRNRIMFPIKNDRDQAIGFSGRLFNQDNGPKYLNTPETPIFNKRNVLYHLSDARQEIRRRKEIVLLEGFMDVIAASSAGVGNGVATMGTSLTTEHIGLIRKITNQIVICYDGDSAGIEAAQKAGRMLEADPHFGLAVLQLPQGKDPDEFIQTYGPEKFEDIYAHNRSSWTAFLLTYLKRGKNLSNPQEQANYLEEAIMEIAKIDQAIEREIYLKQLAAEFDLSLETLRQQLADSLRRKPTANQHADMPYSEPILFEEPKRNKGALVISEEQLLKAMLDSRENFMQIRQLMEGTDFYHDDYQAIYTYLIGFYAEGNTPDTNRFMDYLPEQEQAFKNLVATIEMLEAPEEQTTAAFRDYIASIKKHVWTKKRSELQKKMQRLESENDAKALIETLQEINRIDKLLTARQFDETF